MDKVVLQFVVQGLHPPHIVQQQGFIDLVQHLQPNTNVMTCNTVVNKVTKASVEKKRKLKAALSEIEFIATTTDCWTAHVMVSLVSLRTGLTLRPCRDPVLPWHASNLIPYLFCPGWCPK